LAVSRSSRSPSTQRRPSAALRLEHLLLTAHQRVRAKLPKGSQHDSRRRMKRACRAHAIGGGHRPDCGIHPVTSWRISKPGGVSFPRGALRKVRPVLHHWFGAERVPINGADHHPYAGRAGPVPDRQLRDARETSSAAVRIRTAAAIPAGNPDALSLTATMHPVFCGKSGAVVPPQRACRRADRRMRHCPCH